MKKCAVVLLILIVTVINIILLTMPYKSGIGRKTKHARYLSERNKTRIPLQDLSSFHNTVANSPPNKKTRNGIQKQVEIKKNLPLCQSQINIIRKDTFDSAKFVQNLQPNSNPNKINLNAVPDSSQISLIQLHDNVESTEPVLNLPPINIVNEADLNAIPDSSRRSLIPLYDTIESREPALDLPPNNILINEADLNIVPDLCHDKSDISIKNTFNSIEFFRAIDTYMNNKCCVCSCLFYPKQVHKVKKENLHSNFQAYFTDNDDSFILCDRCFKSNQKGTIPSTAFWNNLNPGPIPQEISILSKTEKRLLARIHAILEVVKFEGRFGQYGLKGQTLLFAQDVTEIQNQLIDTLPRNLEDCNYVAVCERLDGINKERQFEINPKRVAEALNWLINNNPLYADVKVDMNKLSQDLTKIVHSLNTQSTTDVDNNWDSWKSIGENDLILQGSIHINHAMFQDNRDGLELFMNISFIKICDDSEPQNWRKADLDFILCAGHGIKKEHLQTEIEHPSGDSVCEIIHCKPFQNFSVKIKGKIFTIRLYEFNYEQLNLTNYIKYFIPIMEAFSNRFDGGIIECGGHSIAFLQKNEYFFLFDSQNCGLKGHPCKSKNNLNGSSCVMRFTHISSLFNRCRINLKMRNFGADTSFRLYLPIYAEPQDDLNSQTPIDEDPLSTPNVLQQVQDDSSLSMNVLQSPDFGQHQGHIHFRSVRTNLKILRANRRQNGNSCTANCFAALIKAQINKSAQHWNSCDLDDILTAGQSLYDFSLHLRGYSDGQYLMLEDIPQNIDLFGFQLRTRYPDPLLFEENVECHLSTLSTGINSLFSLHNFGILITHGYSYALMKIENNFYFFDPHGCDDKGFTECDGKACLLQTTHVEQIIEHLQLKFRPLNNASSSALEGSSTDRRMSDAISLSFLKLISFEKQANVSTQENQLSRFFFGYQNFNTDLHHNCQSEDGISRTYLLSKVDQNAPLLTNVLQIRNQNENIDEQNEIPLRILQRKTEKKPVNIYLESKAEEFAWYHLFPYGINGLNQPRPIRITPLDYFKTRVMGSDPRFHSIEYLAYALSTYETLRASEMVSVCGRVRQNDERVENVTTNLHLMMKKLRGSYSYWNNQLRDLISLVKCIGPPTLFLTFSSNDLNWADVLTECLLLENRLDDPKLLSWDEKQRLIENHPMAVSRKFMIRVHAVVKFLKNSPHVLGELEDFWWRIEFQNRGSPHLHMLIWIKDAPDLFTFEGIKYIDSVMQCSIPESDEELKKLVLESQVHKHRPTCRKRTNTSCRFGFPRVECKETRMLPPDSVDFRKTNGRICELKRNNNELFINNYNPTLLRLWKGNIDIQPCSTVENIVEYIVKYASKAEPQDINQRIQDAINHCRQIGLNWSKKLYRVSMALLNHRQLSSCEMIYRLCHLKYKFSSRATVFVNTSKPEKRFRMLEVTDSGNNRYFSNIYDKYQNRPDSLEEICLLEFAMDYAPYYHRKQKNDDEEDCDLDAYVSDDDENRNHESTTKPFKLKDGKSWIKLRTRPAAVRTRNFSIQKDRDDYFYSLLVLLIKFRDETELMADFNTAEESFLNKKDLLRETSVTLSYLQFHDEVEAALENAILHEEDRENIRNFQQSYDFVAEDSQSDNYVPMEDRSFNSNVSMLNADQKSVFDHVRNHILKELKGEFNETDKLNETDKKRLFITGGAGTGKSFLLKMLRELIQRLYYDNSLPKNTSFVKLGALTGAAAKLINASTLHSMLKLPLELKGKMKFLPLQGDYLTRMQRDWRHIKFLIIDEVSMISYEMFNYINLRLQNITGNDLLFGGLNVILFGDLLQLNPVKGSAIYKQPLYRTGEIFLWRKFDFIELKINMRQKDDQSFINLLNNVRYGKVTPQDTILLLSRLKSAPEIDEFEKSARNVIKIVATNNEASNYNSTQLEKLIQSTKCRCYTIKAHDRFLNGDDKLPKDLDLKDIIPQEERFTGGLSFFLKLAVGAVVMLRYNVNVSKGLVNGSIGTVISFRWRHFRLDQINDEDIPASVTVDFGSTGVHDIEPINVTFNAKKTAFGKIERTQIPLILAWSVTSHKLQGATIDNAIVSLGKKVFAAGQPYVMLSRCRTLDSIVFDEIDITKISKLVNKDAVVEMGRLKNSSS